MSNSSKIKKCIVIFVNTLSNAFKIVVVIKILGNDFKLVVFIKNRDLLPTTMLTLTMTKKPLPKL